MLHYQYLLSVLKAQNFPSTWFLYSWNADSLLYPFIYKWVWREVLGGVAVSDFEDSGPGLYSTSSTHQLHTWHKYSTVQYFI